MKQEEIKNKDGETLQTKEGQPLLKKTLEVGDEFIPIKNNVIVKENKTEDKIIKNYKIIAKVKTDGKEYKNVEGENEHFIDLTPSQYKTIQKRLDEGIEINQHVWVVYNYESKEYGQQIGVGMKKTLREPINFNE